MKIHSKFVDYYDRVLAHGADANIHYVRDQRTLSYKHDIKWRIAEDISISNAVDQGIGDAGTQIIGFCGILYPYIPLTQRVKAFPVDQYTRHHLYFPDEVDDFADIIGDSWRRGRWSWHDRYLKEKVQSSKRFLSDRIVDDQPFIELAAPVFHIRPSQFHGEGTVIETNPCLKDLGFFKVKDPFTAFQEIAGYLGNQLVQRKEPDQIEDKYRVAQHGFDKWSFRKHKDQKALDNSQQKN